MAKTARFGPGTATGNAAPDLQREMDYAISRAQRGGSFEYRHALSYPVDGLLSQGGAVGSGGVDDDIVTIETGSDGLSWYESKKSAAAAGGTAVFDIPGFGAAASCMVAYAVKRNDKYRGSGPAEVIYIGSGTPAMSSSGGVTVPSGSDATQVALVLSISSGKLRLTFTNSHATNAASVVVRFTPGRTF